MNEASLRKRMQDILDLVIGDIGSIRTGRATPALIEGIEISAYGGQQTLKLNELATITTSDPQTMVIDPWDKSVIGDIKRGIEKANIGMTPNIDGEVIRISLPPLTTEDREKYVKLLSRKLETGRVMVRQARSDEMKEIRNRFDEKEIGEDEKFEEEKKLQEITDEFIGKIEDAGEVKEKELLQV